MPNLAILGGEKAVKIDHSLGIPIVPEEAYESVLDLMRRGDISFSPIILDFERRFADYIGVKYGLCYPNGTISIQGALFAVGVGPGDEVIVPSFTFWGTVGPVVAVNAVPVFADVDLDSHLLTADSIKKCITPRTKAIVVVHTWGNPADMDGIMELARQHSLKVIEDCSHAHGATYKGKKVGSIGDIGCFSLQASKILAAGEGGILVTDNPEYYERAVALGHPEQLSGLADTLPYKKYALTGLGYKHRANPLSIAIAYKGLDRLDKLNEIRNQNAEYFEELISDLSI
jgi:perosamine synthetase